MRMPAGPGQRLPIQSPSTPNGMSRSALTISWILQLVVAVILGQTLFFKFTGAPESRYIFETLGAEPWGRIGSGVVEGIAVLLLLFPRYSSLDALLAIGVVLGAIASHLTLLGIVVQDDGGLLFILAWIVFLAASGVLWLRRCELPIVGSRFRCSERTS